MKILFVGPTLHGAVFNHTIAEYPDIICRGPAKQGDIAEAVLNGATAIGLIDGRYEDVAAPWHKEILFALSKQVYVLGAGSLGALRAAECCSFGMIGVGEIFERLCRGEIVDDSDVAQIHGPAELDYLPLSEPRVNIEATFRYLAARGTITSVQFEHLNQIAQSIFFKELVFERVLFESSLPETLKAKLSVMVERHRVDQKQTDAFALVKILNDLPTTRNTVFLDWEMSEPSVWRKFIAGLATKKIN